MVAGQENGVVKKEKSGVLLDGKVLPSGANVPGPGALEFVEILRRADGVQIPLSQSIQLPPEFFQKDKVILSFAEEIPSLERGTSVPIRFVVRQGYAESFAVFYSNKGEEPSNFQPLLTLPGDRRDFSFRVPQEESDNCYLALVALDHEGKQVADALSNRFQITQAVQELFTVEALPDEIAQNSRVSVRFTFSSAQGPASFKAELANLDTNEDYTLREQIPPNERSFDFIINKDPGKYRVYVVAMNKNLQWYKSAQSNSFRVVQKLEKKAAPVDVLLLKPGNKEKLIAGSNYEIQWGILGVPRDYEDTVRIDYSLQGAGGPYALIGVKEKTGQGTIPWIVPDRGEVFVRVQLSKANLSKVFGPFSILAGPSLPPKELEGELERIIDALGGIRLPIKKSWLSKEVSVGTFLYYLISSNELDSYLTAANRLQDIEKGLESPAVQRRIGSLYAEYISGMRELEKIRVAAQGLGKKKEVRLRVLQLLRAFIPIINTELLADFKKQFPSVDFRVLRAEIIVNNVEYLSWVMERAQIVDKNFGTHDSAFNLLSLYRFMEETMKGTQEMYQELQRLRELATKIKKSLAKSQ